MNLVNSQNLFTIIQRLTILGKDKFVDEEEGRYMRQIDALAREIVENGISMVLLAGPSGSGKTTTAHNLRKCLMRRLMETDRYVYCLSMDDWYMSGDRYTMPLDEEGNPDYEWPERKSAFPATLSSPAAAWTAARASPSARATSSSWRDCTP